MPELHLYRLDDGCTHVMAAADEETALREGRAVYSIGDGDPFEPISCEQIPDEELFTLRYTDGLEPPYPEGAVIDNDLQRVTAPAGAWARLAGNGVYVGGDEY